MTTTKRLIAASLAALAIAAMTWLCAAASGVHWGTFGAGAVAFLGCLVSTVLFGIVYSATGDL